MGDYLQAARNLFGNPDAAYYFRPNGDLVKYLQDTNEFGVLTPNNVISTYFNPSGGANYC